MERLAVILVGLLLLAACAGPESEDPIRLVELDEEARVEMRAPDGGGDARLALVAPAGGRHEAAVAVPKGAPVLVVALGYPVKETPPGVPLRFRVSVAPAGSGADEAVEVLDETLTTAEDGRWADREVSLEPWAGERVRLVLAAEAPTGAEPGAPVRAAWGVPEVLSRDRRPEGWDVVLVVLDTLRADRLGAYGYDRPTSPYLDALAERSTLFTTAVSQSSWTRPSIQSILNGLYPESRNGLDSPPLAEVLRRHGYRTRAVTGGAQLAYQFGFSRGFEQHAIEDWVRAPDRVVETLEADRPRKHFLFLHTYEIHDPYEHRELAAGLDPGRVGEVFRRAVWERLREDLTEGERGYISALYDSGIAYTDRQLGRLIGRLDERGLLDRTLLIVTADHGEELWDHGLWGHGRAMLEHQIRVPLIVRVPPAMREALDLSEGPEVIRQQVRLVDLYPTILDLLGVPLEHEVQGRSLRPLLAGRRLPRAPAFSESVYWGPMEVKSLRAERFKYLRGIPKEPEETHREGWEVVYDLETDPGETEDVKGAHGDLLRRMRAVVDRILRGGSTPHERVPGELDPEVEEQLRALGYID
jgi:arylsulfatase A-like enzyme